jgi:hypothetical protein
MPGMSFADMLSGLLSLIVILIGAWCKQQSDRISVLEGFQTKVLEHWEADAKSYVSKAEFVDLARELKEGLQRIEDKIEKIRG